MTQSSSAIRGRPGRVEECSVPKPLELAVTIVAGAGLPISQLAIRRLGWPGAAAVAAVSAGILAADLASLADNRSEGSVRRVLRLEAAAAGVATVTGALLLLDPGVEEARDEGWRVGRPEMLRRISLGLLFGVLSARLRSRAPAGGQAAGSEG
jgi:hypothetical protein